MRTPKLAVRRWRLVLFVALPTLLTNVAAAQTFSNLYNFSSATGSTYAPTGSLCQASDGNLYGTTYYGGVGNAGAVYRISSIGTNFAVIHSFSGSDGIGPWAGLIQAKDGYLYGTTSSGGAHGKGTIFRVSLTGSFQSLYSFTGGTDGSSPAAPLLQASDGNLYGKNLLGGANGTGVIFEIPPDSSKLSVIHPFEPSNFAYDNAPEDPMIQASDGNIYGTKFIGYSDGNSADDGGFAFRIGLGGSNYKVIYQTVFNGVNPINLVGMIQASDGNLYGKSRSGGTGNQGCIFRLPLAGGTPTVLYNFDGVKEYGSYGSLLQAKDGFFYTTVLAPGNADLIYRVTLSGAVTTVTSLTTTQVSGNCWALIQAKNGDIYGTSTLGGAGAGCVYALNSMALSPWPKFHADAQNSGVGIGAGAGGAVEWKFATGGIVQSPPTIGPDGTIYVGSNDNNLYALAPNGVQKWAFTTGGPVVASPAIGADGTLYFGAGDNKLYAVNPNGTEKWSVTTGDKITYSPAIAFDGTIYTGSRDGKIYAINPDGSTKWVVPLTAADYVVAPALGADGTVYIGSYTGPLYAISPSGSIQWTYSPGGGVISSPSVGSDGTVYVGAGDDNLYALTPSGVLKWKCLTAGSVQGTAAIGADGTIYVGSGPGNFSAITPAGTIKWTAITNNIGVWSSAAIGSDGVIYVGTDDGNMFALNPDGSVKWSYLTGGAILSSPAIASDGTVYIGSNDDNLYAFGPDYALGAFTVSPASVPGGTSANGKVTLTQPAAIGGDIVTLTSNNPAVVPPATVVVPAGQTSAMFAIPTTAVSTTVTAALAASSGGVVKAASLTVEAATLLSVSVAPQNVVGGANAVGTVKLNGLAPAGGLVVSLASDETYATVQPSVTVPAGSNVATFTVSTSAVVTNRSADITATLGSVSISTQIIVLEPQLSSLKLSPSTVNGGATSTATLTLTSIAPSAGILVSIGSSATFATAPATVTVPGGATSVTFPVLTTAVTTSGTATISAFGVSTKTAVLTVNAPVLTGLSLSPASVAGGANSTGTITLASIAPTGGMTVAVASDSTFAVVPATVTVLAGAKTATFPITTVAVSVNGTASISAVLGSVAKVAPLTVKAPVVTALSLNPSSVVGGANSTATVTIGSAAPSGGISVSLASDSAFAPVQSSVTVSGGATTATFPITTIPVSTSGVANISASLGATKTAKLTVNAPTFAGLTISPSSVPGGTISTGTVTLGSVAPSSGATVTLSTNATFATPPANVVVPAGAISATFTINTATVAVASKATISASLGSVTKTATLTVTTTPGDSLTLSPATVQGGLTSTGTITLAMPAPSGGEVISLSSSAAYASLPPAVAITAGSTTGSFTITTAVVGISSKATITASGVATATLTVAPSGMQPGSPWPKFQGNARNTGLTFSSPVTGALKWSAALDNAPATSPAIAADGTIYIAGGYGYLYAFDPNGTQKWAAPGIYDELSGPAIGADGTIYIGGGDNNGDSYLYAFNPNGSQKWKFLLDSYIFSSPLIGEDGSIYFCSVDGLVYALTPPTTAGGSPTVKWSYKIGDVDQEESSPALGPDGTIYIGSPDNYVYALTPSGSLKWKFLTAGPVFGSPTIGSDGTIYIGSADGNFYAITSGGSVKWSYATGYVGSTAAIGQDGTIYVGSLNGQVYALSPGGIQKWAFATGSSIYSSPVAGFGGTIFVGSCDHKLYAIGPDGLQLWAYQTGYAIVGSPAIGADGTLYIASEDGNFYAFGDPSNFAYPSFASAAGLQLNGNTTFTSPTVTMTDGGAGESSSMFFATPVDVSGFQTEFEFTMQQAVADGLTFCITTLGPQSLGGGGGDLGYGGIGNSVAIKYDLYSDVGDDANSTGIFFNGADPFDPSIPLAPVQLNSGDMMKVQMAYALGVLRVTTTDEVTGATSVQTYSLNIPTSIGAASNNLAYVGFTAGTGALSSIIQLHSWTFAGGS